MPDERNEIAIKGLDSGERLLVWWDKLPKVIRWGTPVVVSAVVAIWGFAADLVIQARVAVALVLFGAVLFSLRQVRFFLAGRAKAPVVTAAVASTADPNEGRARAFANQIDEYRRGIIAIGVELAQRSLNDVAAGNFGPRFNELRSAALHAILREKGLFVGDAGRRFIGPHPETPLVRNVTEWGPKNFELYVKVDSTIRHLRDFQTELGYPPGNKVTIMSPGAHGAAKPTKEERPKVDPKLSGGA